MYAFLVGEIVSLRDWTPPDGRTQHYVRVEDEHGSNVELLVGQAMNGETPTVGTRTGLVIELYRAPDWKAAASAGGEARYTDKRRLVGVFDPASFPLPPVPAA